MRVSIIVEDMICIIDGVHKKLSGFDWTPFADVHAVQAWLDKDRAEVEFALVDPDGPGPLPAHKPENELIDGAEFTKRFASIIAAWDAAPAPVQEETPAQMPIPPADTEALLARLAALEQSNQVLQAQVNVFIKEAGGT